MRQLNKIETWIYLVGAAVMVIGAAAAVLMAAWAPWVYAAGALCFVAMQLLQRYDGPNVTIRRLRRIMIFSDLMFLLTALLMFASMDNPLHLPHITYLQYVYRKWVVTLLIAAILQLYVTHRISHELEQEAKKS